jgi:FAD/FMN-containing dehydrogenase
MQRRRSASSLPVIGDTLPEAAKLGLAVTGEVILPGAREYAAACTPPIARYDDEFLRRVVVERPRAIVRCMDPSDVSATIAHARRHHLDIAIRSGGHCFTGCSSTGGIVIDVSPMCSLSIRADHVRVGPGMRLEGLYDALHNRGRTLPAGSGATVGIAGLTLAGGLGILGRTHGLTCDQLLGAQIVLADGRTLDCDEHHESELFWALRGAGSGHFGVVTSLLLRTVEASPATAFHLSWSHRLAAAVAQSWQHWAPRAPEELAASLLFTVPAAINEPPCVSLFGAMLGDDVDTHAWLQGFTGRVGADPQTIHVAHGSYHDARRYLTALGDQFEELDRASSQPVPAFSKSEFFRRTLPAGALVRLLANLVRGRRVGETRELDFMPWGGAYNRPPIDATAFPHRRERFLLKQTVALHPHASREQKQAARRWLARSWDVTHPYGSGGVYANFPDSELSDPARAYYGSNLDRLQVVKRNYDPHGVFRSGPAGSLLMRSTPRRGQTRKTTTRERTNQ